MPAGPRAIAVWGSNTDVGKTLVSAGVFAAARRRALDALYLKPVQTGVCACACRERCRDTNTCGAHDTNTCGAQTHTHPCDPCELPYASTCHAHLAAGRVSPRAFCPLRHTAMSTAMSTAVSTAMSTGRALSCS